MNNAKKERRRSPSHIGVGVASVVMIFTVLCLTALGVLALSGARSKSRLSSKRIEFVSAYYRAEAEAQRQLALFDGSCASGAAQSGDEISVSIPIYDDINLDVKLKANGDGTARVSGHTIENTAQWEMGERLLFP